MKTIKYFILFFFFISCYKKQEENVIIVPNKDIIENAIIESESDIKNKVNDSVYVVRKENRESFIKLFYSKDQNKNITFDSIIIKNKENSDIQKIKFKKDYFLRDWEVETCLLAEEDINFDGFNDIGVINYKGNYNSSFSYWVYKKNQKKYKKIRSLDSIQNPNFNKETKEIYSRWRAGLSEFHDETYIWKSDEIILKAEYIKYITDDSINPEIEYSRKLIDGKYIEKGAKY